MSQKRATRPCGSRQCSVSTGYDDMTLTFGRGDLDDYGYWEKPCLTCAAAHQKEYPNSRVWPFEGSPPPIAKPEIHGGQRWVRKEGVNSDYVLILYWNLYDGTWQVETSEVIGARTSVAEAFIRENYTLQE